MYTNIFSKFRSCWGGGSETPVVKAAGIRQQIEEQGGNNHSITGTIQIRPMKVRIKSRGDGLRKPKLRAINEDLPMMDVTVKINRHQWSSGTKGNDDNNNNKKLKQKPPSRDKDYGKSFDAVTVPTIAPMSFMF